MQSLKVEGVIVSAIVVFQACSQGGGDAKTSLLDTVPAAHVNLGNSDMQDQTRRTTIMICINNL